MLVLWNRLEQSNLSQPWEGRDLWTVFISTALLTWLRMLLMQGSSSSFMGLSCKY